MTPPTPAEAGALLAEAASAGKRLRAGAGARTGAWLTGMAVATTSYLTSLGIAGNSDREVAVASLVFGAVVAVLSSTLLPGVRVTAAGFGRRWTASVLGWGALYAVALVVGLTFQRGELLFWSVAGVVTALPLVLGARAELRS